MTSYFITPGCRDPETEIQDVKEPEPTGTIADAPGAEVSFRLIIKETVKLETDGRTTLDFLCLDFFSLDFLCLDLLCLDLLCLDFLCLDFLFLDILSLCPKTEKRYFSRLRFAGVAEVEERTKATSNRR